MWKAKRSLKDLLLAMPAEGDDDDFTRARGASGDVSDDSPEAAKATRAAVEPVADSATRSRTTPGYFEATPPYL
jgi:hypothetical protein